MEQLSTLDLIRIVVEILLGLVAFFGTLIINNLIGAIKELRKADKELGDKFDSYVRRDDLQDIKKQIAGIFERLDDIKDAIGTKVSREECLYRQQNNHGGK